MEDWTEKYRPKTLDEIVGNERAITELRKWANEWNKGGPKKRAIILSGKPGIGKTSAAIALANDNGWAYIELNTSDARNASKIKHVATFGAINETFDDTGRYISSREGGRKLIILDEADNLYETAAKSNDDKDLSDRGGKKAIVDTIKITNQPIILIVNDYYGLIKGAGESLKNTCRVLKFYEPYPNAIFNLLKRVSLREGINVDQKVLHTIADRCKGDIRSAINDLQSICLDKTIVDTKSLDVLGYRDREKIIFDALREIFKTKNIQNLRESTLHLDEDPNSVILWVNENMPLEYRDFNDLSEGYNAISLADIFLGRTYRTQNYSLWSYACDFMNGGVAVAKNRIYPNEKYNFPAWLKEIKVGKPNRDLRSGILKKLSRYCHNSSDKSKDMLKIYFEPMFQNDTSFAIKMKNKFELSESEIKYLLGDKYQHKIDEILKPTSITDEIIETTDETTEQIKLDEKEKKENIQQSLLDF